MFGLQVPGGIINEAFVPLYKFFSDNISVFCCISTNDQYIGIFVYYLVERVTLLLAQT
jgi:hypothetical protein